MDKSMPLIVALRFVLVMVDHSTQDLPLAAACRSANATCLSPSQCCSGICYKKCIARCQSVNYVCSPSSDACCAGLKCGQSTKRCCRLAGQHSRTPSECCSQSWKSNINGGGTCCSQHAESYSSDGDCCSSTATCSHPQWSKICIWNKHISWLITTLFLFTFSLYKYTTLHYYIFCSFILNHTCLHLLTFVRC